jgi:hypothetical protein
VASPRFPGNFDQAYADDQAYAGDRAYAGDEAYEAYEFDEPAPRDRTGGLIVAIVATVAGVLVLSAVLWLVFGKRQQGPPFNPNPPSAAQTQLAADAHRYLAIADPANQQLNNEVNAYTTNERSNLAAARANLRAEVGTTTRFDRQLAAIKFPAAIEPIARDVIQANQARGLVVTRQARAKTLARMQALNTQHQAADAAVEVQVKRLRQALHLPAASSS